MTCVCAHRPGGASRVVGERGRVPAERGDRLGKVKQREAVQIFRELHRVAQYGERRGGLGGRQRIRAAIVSGLASPSCAPHSLSSSLSSSVGSLTGS